MKLLYNADHRCETRGFTLLETILALALMGVVLSGVYALSARSTAQASQAKQSFLANEFARSLMDEYLLANSTLPETGTYKDTWNWKISERETLGIEETPVDGEFSFIEVSIEVSEHNNANFNAVVLTAITTRKPKKR